MYLPTEVPKFHIALRGEALLNNPRWNKGSAFTVRERKEFGLIGRLPSRVNDIDMQCKRAYNQLQMRDTAIAKNSFLQSLKDQNWVLYYTLLSRHLEELTPIIYTPTEAEAISKYSHLFRRTEGLYLTFTHQDSMEDDFLEQTRGRDIDLVVVTDAEAILGIGDQGVGGIWICTAKAVIYTLIGGINPANILSVTLDVGTDNESLLNDELYIGWQHKRVRGKEYDDFVDKFMQLVRKYYPPNLVHFEDFGVDNAHRLIKHYSPLHSVFNDDIQGTGAVTLATVLSAVKVTRGKLPEQRYVIFGAGSAGLGIAYQLRDAMVDIDGISEAEANKLFYLVDKDGLLTEQLAARGGVRDEAKPFMRPGPEWQGAQTDEQGRIGLLEVVRRVKPTVLIGCSTVPKAFNDQVVKEMAKSCERPIILPLSNPSRLVEVDPQEATDWTEGRALLATGSPFPPARKPNGKQYPISECNNALIYPGLGLGNILCRSRRLTDRMIVAGACRLAELSPALTDPDGALLPDFRDAPNVNFEIAVAVIEEAIEEGVAEVDWKKERVKEEAKRRIWKPVYGEYFYDPKGETK
ncbi:putative malic enzyme, NAD binding domain [Lyophyllum shimeji]|uniref:Malic enzyme n=1 Tax=Lyophyllum shimeji TaxID=47721 RepID=A0A9P3PSC6_LYOSH|nr:putative malic enzyme, NAD binding domain [Lyophyllum shimeji]